MSPFHPFLEILVAHVPIVAAIEPYSFSSRSGKELQLRTTMKAFTSNFLWDLLAGQCCWFFFFFFFFWHRYTFQTSLSTKRPVQRGPVALQHQCCKTGAGVRNNIILKLYSLDVQCMIWLRTHHTSKARSCEKCWSVCHVVFAGTSKVYVTRVSQFLQPRLWFNSIFLYK